MCVCTYVSIYANIKDNVRISTIIIWRHIVYIELLQSANEIHSNRVASVKENRGYNSFSIQLITTYFKLSPLYEHTYVLLLCSFQWFFLFKNPSILLLTSHLLNLVNFLSLGSSFTYEIDSPNSCFK